MGDVRVQADLQVEGTNGVLRNLSALDLHTSRTAAATEATMEATRAAVSTTITRLETLLERLPADAVAETRDGVADVITELQSVLGRLPTDTTWAAAIAELRDRVGSYGAGVPEVGTSNALLREIRDALATINTEVGQINIDGDLIGLNTDELEGIMRDVGAAIGTTADGESLNTLIGRVKRLLAEAVDQTSQLVAIDTTMQAVRTDLSLLAREVTIARKFAGGKTTRAVEVGSAGVTPIITPTGPTKRIRVLWVGLSTSELNARETLVSLRFGSGPSAYRWNMGVPGAFSHWEPLEGAPGEAFNADLSHAVPVQVNFTYEEFE